MEEMESISRELKGISLMVNMVECGKTQLLSKDELYKLGYKLIIWPITTLLTAVKMMEQQLLLLKEEGISNYNSEDYYTFNQFTDLMGLPNYQSFSKSLLENK
jgi:2-methylisocitrate lyase-like PEP mutase family enzyme